MSRKKCLCGKNPTYNFIGQTKPICCFKCKKIDMVDVKNKKCSCGTQPNFNIPGQSKPICCFKCKTDDMINVTDKTCPCGTRPIFNVPGKLIGICCSKCKTADMIDVRNKKCQCGLQPCYNIPGQTKPICCKDCKTNEMIDVRNRICPGHNGNCPVKTQLSYGYDYCVSCDPNDARQKVYKRFEEAFFAYVKDKIDIHQREFRVTFDQKETAKKFAKLDGIVFGNGIIVCIEIDENSHQDYECDEHRMHLVTAELLQKYTDHVVSWVRVNPTVNSKNQWNHTSNKIREKRFENVITIVNDILESCDTRVVYIGF